MESNQNEDKHKADYRPKEAAIDLKNSLPLWLQCYFRTSLVSQLEDINEGIIEGYPLDDDF